MSTANRTRLQRDFGFARTGRAQRLGIRGDVRIDLLLFLAGSSLLIAVYGSIAPLFIASIFWVAGIGLLLATRTHFPLERAMLTRLFVVGYVMVGIGGFYANVLDDPMQLTSDAASFYDLARSESADLALEDLRVITEGAGAVLVWRSIYDAFAAIGFEKARYIGAMVNVLAVALAGVISMRMARTIYGADETRLRRLILFFSYCGLLWLFAAIHLRDGVVFLAVTANCFVWLRYRTSPTFVAFVLLILANVLLFIVFAFLRTEFIFVPVALSLAFFGSTLLSQNIWRGHRRQYRVFLSYAVALILVGLLFFNYGEDIVRVLTQGNEGYLALSVESSSSSSLGMSLIVDQPLLIRLVLGSLYLFVFPIPFWAGIQFESAYLLFKSFNVLFFYAFTPLLFLSLRRIYQRGEFRTDTNVFLVLVTFGFTLAIAGTSLETRHLGVFLSPIFVLALGPNLSGKADRRAYKRLLLCFLLLMAIVHIAWSILKFVV